MQYEANELLNYVKNSQLLIINDDLRIRLSCELFEKHKKGLYDKQLSSLKQNIEEIKKLNIKYPANAIPIFYIYIVPTDNFKKLLNFPNNRGINGGGKPVKSYDLDSFNSAYGITSNIMERTNEANIISTVNNIHELSHLVHSMFFQKDRFISEGFAEALPLYILNYESKFPQYIDCLKSLTEKQILSAKELIKMGNDNTFDSTPLIPNTSISFEIPYISSYLFVKGCIQEIEKKFKLHKIEAMQKFLEIIKNSNYYSEWLIFDIANVLEINKEELLNKKEMQIDIIKNM